MCRALTLFFAFVVIVTIAPGCSGGGSSSGSGGGDSPSHGGSVVVGVTSEFRVGVDIDRLRVQMWAGDKRIKDEVFSTESREAKLELPAEFPFLDVDGEEIVKIQLDAFAFGDDLTPLVTRVAATRVIPDKKLLLRVQLEPRCSVAYGPSAPVCAAPTTCIAGACGDALVEPKSLLPYAESWSKVTNDICKSAAGGAPIVTVGEGQADYLPMADLDEAQVEAGPQGGHHIWIAIRQKNLLQSGSLTRVTGHFPDLDLDVSPMQVIFTFDQDEGGYCKLYGMRFQLDQNHDIASLLGKVLKVTVKVTDKDGDVGTGERTVTLSQDLL
jgi:hypothetical protein